MTRTIDIPTFQAAVVRNCSPTLAGIKPASLFTYPGTYAHGDGSTATETIAERRARLLNVCVYLPGAKDLIVLAALDDKLVHVVVGIS